MNQHAYLSLSPTQQDILHLQQQQNVSSPHANLHGETNQFLLNTNLHKSASSSSNSSAASTAHEQTQIDDLTSVIKYFNTFNKNEMFSSDGSMIPVIKFHFAPFDPVLHNLLNPHNMRQELLFLCRQAELAERFHDMALLARHIVHITGGRLSREERTLFYIAHTRTIIPLRSALKVINQHFTSVLTHQLATEYRHYIAYQLKTSCVTLIDYIVNVLLQPHLTLPDHVVFFHKMVGDLYKYLAELNPLSATSPKSFTNHYTFLCRYYYHEGARHAEVHLSITSPIRLGLLLAYSVAAFDLFRDYKTACELVKTAFDKAITKLEELDEEDYRDSTLLLQLMRDNLQLWVTMQHSTVHPVLHPPPTFDYTRLQSYPNSAVGRSILALATSAQPQQQY